MPAYREDDYHRSRGRRRSSLLSDSEDDCHHHERRKRARDRSIDRSHTSRSDHQIRDRSRSPFRNRPESERIAVDKYHPPKRQRRDSRNHDISPERQGEISSSSPELRPNSKKHDHGHLGYHSTHARAQPPSYKSQDSRDRHPESYRKSSRSPIKRHRDQHRTSRPLRSVSNSPPSKQRRRDRSRDHHRSSKRHRSKSRSPRRHRSRKAPRPSPPPARSHVPLPSQEDAFNGIKHPPPATASPTPKEKPNYQPSGKLAAETNTVANTSIVLKYNEPATARLPPASAPWRLYIYKGDALLETLALHTRSCWLFGRERLVVDVPTEHPSCSKQHAVIQFRHVQTKNEFGDTVAGVKPYLLDLESANGSLVNAEKAPPSRYVELKSGDLIRFGESTRDYVLLLPPKE